MYPENPEGTQVIVGSMNMGYMLQISVQFYCFESIVNLSESFSLILTIQVYLLCIRINNCWKFCEDGLSSFE